MSCAYRNLARLPLPIFAELVNVVQQDDDDEQAQQTNDAVTMRGSICAKLQRNSKEAPTVGAFLKQSCVTLVRILDPLLTYEECVTLRNRICTHCAPRPVSALALLQNNNVLSPLSTGMPFLDNCLKGGLRRGTISELVGAAGVGKTQFVLQLCVEAAKKGFGTVYIDTEKKLSLERLREIATVRAGGGGFMYNNNEQHQQPLTDGSGGYKAPNQVLNNVTVHSPSSTKELLSLIQSVEEEILLRNDEAVHSNQHTFPVHLLIIDSIAAPSRREFGSAGSSAMQRSALLMEIAAHLKKLADQLQLYVIVVNQQVSSERAALGNSWHHCLSTRILMEQQQQNNMRKATLVKSHVAGNVSMNYQITMQGLEEMEIQEMQQ